MNQTGWQEAFKARWAGLGPREQRAVLLAASVLGAALLWSLAVAPALRTVKAADAQRAQLDATAERMLALQARAQMLQARPEAAPGEMLRSLQNASAALGKSASLQVAGEQATLSVKHLRASELAPLLAPAAGAGPNPGLAHLQRDAAGQAGSEALWSGTLVYRLPASQPATP